MVRDKNYVKVWDILVRIFHWSLVVFFFIAYVTEEESFLHIYSGYIVLALVLFRIVWGVIGTKYARFSNFIYSPASALGYLKSLVFGKPKHYLGHNPAGGLMVVALLLSLFVTTYSGLKTYAIEEGKGPLAANSFSLISNAYADDDDYYGYRRGKYQDKDEFWEELHEASANFTLFLIFIHIFAVVVSSKLHNEDLIKPMITGKKKIHKE